MVAVELEPVVIADDSGIWRHLVGRHGVGDALPVVSALKFLVVAMTVLFAATWVLPIMSDLPVWVSAVLVNGVYITATTLVILRAVLVPKQRLAWALLAAAFGCYTAATLYSWVVTGGVDALPFPSVSDIGWLLLYPLAYAGIIVLIRDEVPHSRVRMYLDGATAGLGGAAVFSAIVIGLLIQSSDAQGLTTVVALAYPAGDALLIGTLLCLLTISGWRRRGNLGMLTVSMVVFAIADTGYIVLASHATYMPGGAVDVLYLSALTLIGLAAWRKARPRMAPTEGRGDTAMLALPAVFAVASLGLLLLATEVPVSFVAVTLAGLTLVAIMVRTIVTFRELKAAQEEVADKTDELQHQALHDMLTGLANRALIHDRVERALVRARRNHTPIAAMFLDLDGFKGVNDTFGHGVGDQLLQGVSARLTGAVRDSDTVGRLGGDEFIVLVEGDSLDAGPEVIAERIKEVLAPPFLLGGNGEVTVYTHGSIGIAVGIRSSADELLRDADVALYEAKQAGRDRFIVFAPEMQSAVQDRIELEMDLRDAIGTPQLFLAYQPTFNLAAQTITGV